MLFNSFEFGIFLPLIFLLYWGLGSSQLKGQNILILLASYFFYGMWDWRFLALIFLSSIVDYFAAQWISKSSLSRKRKTFLYLSLFWNLGVLFVFKYYNFFLDNLRVLFDIPESSFTTLEIIVPVGLSFYTFQTISYTLDVYKGKTKPSENILQFLCFVSFFPQLVAGPIERAAKLLPQFAHKRKFNMTQAKDGLRLILWGLFKKVVVADNLAVAVNTIYENPANYSGPEIFYASTLFFFQIYCDFSGYSDIAIGTAKLFGFDLSINFKTPYFAKNVSSFWERWHITLSRWFKDYVYAPILKNRKPSQLLRFVALMLTMTLIGVWHGANWTFVIFGAGHGIILFLELQKIKIRGKKKSIRQLLHKYSYLGHFHLAMVSIFSALFFRSENVTSAFTMLESVFTKTHSGVFHWIIGAKLGLLLLMIGIEYATKQKSHPFQALEKRWSAPVRWSIYYLFIFLILRFGSIQEEFIYFQF